MDLHQLVYGDSPRFSWLLRAGAALIWLVMVYDLLDRVTYANLASLLVSIGFVLFTSLVVLLPVTFGMRRPQPGAASRLAFDALALSGLGIALVGLLIPVFGQFK